MTASCRSLRQANILVVGDGDLSFALAFAKDLLTNNKTNEMKLIASTFDSLDTLQLKYPGVESTIKKLKEYNFVNIFHSIDATNLTYTLKNEDVEIVEGNTMFGRVIWNFPHAGGKNFIAKNRELMRKFFISAGSLLHRDVDATIEVSLVCGQGGTDFEIVNVPDDVQKLTKKPWKRKYADHWQVVEQAALSGFYLKEAKFFDPPGIYRPRGYRDVVHCAQKGFRTNFSVTHSFCRFIEVDYDESCSRYKSMYSSLSKCVENHISEIVPCVIGNMELIKFIPSFPYSIPFNIPHIQHKQVYTFPEIVDCSEVQQIISSTLQLIGLRNDIHWNEVDNEIRLSMTINVHSIQYRGEKEVRYCLGVLKSGVEGYTWELSLEQLLACILKIDDVRWVMSNNICTLEQLEDLTSQILSQGDNEICFKETSIFSSIFQYDISFWLPEGKTVVDEHEIGKSLLEWKDKSVIRGFELIERYTKSANEISECYRVTYQRLDGALHPEQAKQIQNDMAQHLEQTLQLRMRN